MLFFINNEIVTRPDVDLVSFLKNTVRKEVDDKEVQQLNSLTVYDNIIYMEEPKLLTFDQQCSFDGREMCYGKTIEHVVEELYYTKDYGHILVYDIEQYAEDLTEEEKEWGDDKRFIYLHYFIIANDNPYMRKFKVTNLLNSY